MFGKPIKILIFVIISGIAAGSGAVIVAALYDKMDKYPHAVNKENPPKFSIVEFNFNHRFSILRGVPYASGAAVDINKDGRDEVFVGGGLRQPDALFLFQDNSFVDISDQIGLVKQGDGMTTGAAVFDIDDNGYSDLIISREKGIYVYRNDGKTLSQQKLNIEFSENDIPLGVTVTDINRDGSFDFLVPFVERGTLHNWFLLKETEKRTLARLYVNNGDESFYDITDSVGLEYSGGALQGAFADLDGDGLEDMVVLYTDGTLNTWKNRGNLLFENKHHSMSSLKGDFMGMAIGDYNDDGRIDFLLTNRGSTIPAPLAKLINRYRPLRHSKWVLMKNMGFFSFHNDADKTQLADYELARGAILSDFNADGRLDIAVSQNHPYWPAHMLKKLRLPGRFLMQGSDGKFSAPGEGVNLESDTLGLTPFEADVNGDGRPDIVQINLGGPSRVLINSSVDSNFLKIVLPDSAKSIGAKVRVKMLSGKVVTRHFLPGRELCSDSTHAMFVGLGREKATDVMVDYNDGKKDQTSGVLYNTIITFE